MFKKTIVYTDYDGVQRKEDYYFNLTKSELLDMEFGQVGGMEAMLRQVVQKRDIPQLAKIFRTIIQSSYGIKSPDGKRFIKNKDVLDEFVQSPAYDELYVEIVTNAEAAANFIKSIIPADIVSKMNDIDMTNPEEALAKLENA